MTLLVGLQGADGMVLACDSRGTFGDPRLTTAQNDTIIKLYEVSRYAGVMIAGNGDLGSTIMDAFKAKGLTTAGVLTIVNELRKLLCAKYKEWFSEFAIQNLGQKDKPTRPDLGIIVGGIEGAGPNKPGKQYLIQLQAAQDFAPMTSSYGFILVGVPQYALYLMNRLYRPDCRMAQIEHLAYYVISETASQDGKVGGPIRVARITPGEGYRPLTDAELTDISNRNEQRSAELARSFFGDLPNAQECKTETTAEETDTKGGATSG